MASLLEQNATANDANFILRVKQALVAASIDVAAEDAPDYRRANFSREVLLNPESYAQRMAYGVAANAVITLASSDSDIQFTVNSLFDAYAGAYEVTTPEPQV